mgnify:CR=1 FL=1
MIVRHTVHEALLWWSIWHSPHVVCFWAGFSTSFFVLRLFFSPDIRCCFVSRGQKKRKKKKKEVIGSPRAELYYSWFFPDMLLIIKSGHSAVLSTWPIHSSGHGRLGVEHNRMRGRRVQRAGEGMGRKGKEERKGEQAFDISSGSHQSGGRPCPPLTKDIT